MRDQQMLALREQSGQGGLPLPSALSGPGLFLAGDPLAAQMFLQRKVARSGKQGWFDDLVGGGFCLICRGGDPAAHLSSVEEAFFTSIGGQIVSLSSSTDEYPAHLLDLSGAYADWFAANHCTAVLIRPDRAIYGTAPDLAGVAPLVRSLYEQLHSAT